jgi:hypothetical protein
LTTKQYTKFQSYTSKDGNKRSGKLKKSEILLSSRGMPHNSCKNELINPKRELEQQLMTAKQYTMFQSYTYKNDKKSPEN